MLERIFQKIISEESTDHRVASQGFDIIYFSQVLAGTPDDIGPEISDDEVIVQKRAELFHVSSDTGKLVIKKLGTAPFRQKQLLTGDCYILDNGSNGTIFVWKGECKS